MPAGVRGASLVRIVRTWTRYPHRMPTVDDCEPLGSAGRRAVRQLLLTGWVASAYADGVETSAEIAEAAGSADPDVGLRAVAALRMLTERLEVLQVDNARQRGWSWQEIANRLGVTKQTVHRKHGRRTGRLG